MLISGLLLISSSLPAHDLDSKVIYGDDDRAELDANQPALMRLQGQSVALITERYRLDRDQSLYRIQGRNFANEHNLCSEERFYDQTVLGNCTGFLIAEDILVTAAHCIESEWACKETAFIFGFTDANVYRSNHVYEARVGDVYFCKEIIKSKHDVNFELDFSIVRLDRKVIGREPLKYRATGRLPYYETVYTIGHPAGLSMKISNNGSLIQNAYNAYFTAAIDTIVGASGSPVFATSTGLVEGVLMNGEFDFEMSDDGCYVSKKCSANGSGCRGEFIQRLSEILPYLP